MCNNQKLLIAILNIIWDDCRRVSRYISIWKFETVKLDHLVDRRKIGHQKKLKTKVKWLNKSFWQVVKWCKLKYHVLINVTESSYYDNSYVNKRQQSHKYYSIILCYQTLWKFANYAWLMDIWVGGVVNIATLFEIVPFKPQRCWLQPKLTQTVAHVQYWFRTKHSPIIVG